MITNRRDLHDPEGPALDRNRFVSRSIACGSGRIAGVGTVMSAIERS
jgi:hypothetical protein